MGVTAEVRLDAIDGLVERGEIGVALRVGQIGRNHLGAAVEGQRDDVGALFQAEADERLHHRRRPNHTFAQLLQPPRWRADVLELDVFLADCAFQEMLGDM